MHKKEENKRVRKEKEETMHTYTQKKTWSKNSGLLLVGVGVYFLAYCGEMQWVPSI